MAFTALGRAIQRLFGEELPEAVPNITSHKVKWDLENLREEQFDALVASPKTENPDQFPEHPFGLTEDDYILSTEYVQKREEAVEAAVLAFRAAHEDES